ncbi:MAG: DUF2225 domain-containing protein [Firmicutes bacterium]|nr:DUF2225 domain-containing protein [Bacillota bacterium]
MDKALYDKSCTCLMCASEFTTKKVRSSYIRTLGHDSDLCSHFQGVIPYYYESNVCPECGYAFTESFTPLRSDEKESLYADYKKRYLPQGIPNLCDPRDEEAALLSFQLALGAGYGKKEAPRILAGICMRLAWLHRMAERTEEEMKFLDAANRFFQVAFETQADRKHDAHFLHMLGDTSLRLGRLEEARRWFSQLFRPTYADYAYLDLAREAWALRKQD